MKFPAPALALTPQTEIGAFATTVAWLIRRALLPAAIVLIAEVAILFITGNPGAVAFAMIAGGAYFICAVWQTDAIGLPIMPLIAVQYLVVYGLPIVIDHEVIHSYPVAYLSRAGLEVLLFSLSLTAAWRFGMLAMQPALPISYGLHGFRQQSGRQLRRLGFSLILASTAYLVAQSLGLLNQIYSMLPTGSYSVLTSLTSATSVCGFFLIAMFVGSGVMSPGIRLLFWLLLATNGLLSAAGFLLSAATATLAATLIGLFWSTGRMPWRFLVVVTVVLSFLNLGKFTMRERYWPNPGEPEFQFQLTQIPRYYGEWAEASYDALSPTPRDSVFEATHTTKGQSLLDRINNLQNLLFVIDAIDNGHITPLYGETYTLIPFLLVPRIFWPDKPRSHEGQVLLNVHFGRQDLNSTFDTYVAWGLLPEACGNFGEKLGGLMLGAVLGLLFAWVENQTARKLLLSLEGFIAFIILLSMANSFEMVASVLVTTISQSVIVLIIGGIFFVERTQPRRPPGSAS